MDIIRNISQLELINLIKCKSEYVNIHGVEFSYLGRGGEGIVYQIGDTKYAMKIYKQKSKFNKEIVILKRLNKISDGFLKIHGNINLYGHQILFMDLINGSLENWAEKKRSDREWICMIVQILCGLLILQTKLQICHTDMKPKNILYKHTEPVNFKFSFDNLNIMFKTSDFFYISDFGHAQSNFIFADNNKIDKDKIDLCIENNLDLGQLGAFHKRLAVSIITKFYTLSDLMNIGKKDTHFVEYSKKIKEEINVEFKKYGDSVKYKMLFRDISYYLLEKNYFDIENLPHTDSSSYVLPSNSVINILESLNEVKGYGSLANKINDLYLLI